MTQHVLLAIGASLTGAAYLIGSIVILYYHKYRLRLKGSFYFFVSYLFGILAMLIRLISFFITDTNTARIVLAIQGTTLGLTLFFLLLAIIIQQTDKIPPWISVASLMIGFSTGLSYNPRVLVAYFNENAQFYVIDFKQPITIGIGAIGMILISLRALLPIIKKISKDKRALRQDSVILAILTIALLVLWIFLLALSEIPEITVLRYFFHFIMVISWTWLLIRNPLTFTITEDQVKIAIYMKKRSYRRFFHVVPSNTDASNEQLQMLLRTHVKPMQPLLTETEYPHGSTDKHLFISKPGEHLTVIFGNKSILLLETKKPISFGLLQLCDYYISLVENKYSEIFGETGGNLIKERELKRIFVKLLKEHTLTSF